MSDKRTDGQPIYRLTLRAKPDRVPAAKRVAQLLKHAGRYLGLVCVEAVEVKPPAPSGTGQATAQGGDQG
jgi:hypothetical protein